MGHFRDWRFRHKMLWATLLPLVVVTGLMALAYVIKLERVGQDVLPQRTDLLELEALSREFQSEVREFLLTGEAFTLEEIAEIQDELEELGIPEDLQPRFKALVGEGRRLIQAAQTVDGSSTTRVQDDLERFEILETELEDAVGQSLIKAEAQLTQALNDFLWWIGSIACLGLITGLGMALWTARWIEKPLHLLQEASGRILDGDFEIGHRVDSRDELGDLARGFDQASKAIRALLATKEENMQVLQENQAQLLRSARLAAVGELAAGVAHEINNPLSVVLTYSVLLKEKAQKAPPQALDALPKLMERLQLVEDASRRCKTIADNLLTFSRQQDDASRQPVDVAALIDDAVRLIRPLMRREGLRLTCHVDDGVPDVSSNAQQMQQVLFNLLSNAIQASPEGGELRVHAVPRDDGCAIQVSDHGEGIPPDVMGRIFEPFFTTKPVGQGTGLGLSIVYGIVQSHGGTIHVESDADRGTTFTVWLPAAKDARG